MDNKIVEIRTTLQQVFGTGVEEIAQEKGFVQRLSKLTGLKFVEIWVMGLLEKATASLNYLVQVAADVDVSITKQGLQDRLSRGAVDFLMAVLKIVARSCDFSRFFSRMTEVVTTNFSSTEYLKIDMSVTKSGWSDFGQLFQVTNRPSS